MHADVRPFWPLLATNPLQGAIEIYALHLVCVAAGCAGAVLLAVFAVSRQSASSRRPRG
jgi:hypothetical protein